MFDLYIDPLTGDLAIEDGDFKTTSSKKEFLRQRMQITFNTYVGEWFLNTSFGGINKAILFRKGATKEEIDAWFISVIRSFDEVEQIYRFDSEINTDRSYTLNFSVKTSEDIYPFYITALRPDVEVLYPEPSVNDPTALSCISDVTTEMADAFYKFIHITSPDELPLP